MQKFFFDGGRNGNKKKSSCADLYSQCLPYCILCCLEPKLIAGIFNKSREAVFFLEIGDCVQHEIILLITTTN